MPQESIRIAFLVDGLTSRYQLRLFTGARRAARRRGAHLIGFQGAFLRRLEHERARFDASFLYDLAVPQAVDGLIPVSTVLASTIGLEAVNRLCERSRLPCVSVGETGALPYVGLEPSRGLRELIHHLVRDHGRRHFGFIRGNPTNSEGCERERVFRETLRELGLKVDESLLLQGNFLEASGVGAVRTLLEERGVRLERWDALVSANDQMAAGAAQELARRGIRVPRDIALVGFDDDEYARSMNPPLTTVAQPVEELGERVVELLCDLVSGQAIAESTLLATKPVLRRSCGCCDAERALYVSNQSAEALRSFHLDNSNVVPGTPTFPGDASRLVLLSTAVCATDAAEAERAREDFSAELLATSSHGADPLRWDDLLSPLCSELERADAPELERARQLRSLVQETASRGLAQQRLRVIQRAAAARALGSALACAKDQRALARVLESTIGGLGVSYCDVCLFVRGSDASAAKLVAHYADDFASFAELPYDAGELWRKLPESTPPAQGRSSVVFPTANLIHDLGATVAPALDLLIYPLVFAEQALGYVVFDAPISLEDTWLLESVAGHLSSALNALARAQELRHARELAERASAAKSEFVAMMSHEVRTPLNAVLGHLDLCLQGPLESEPARHVSRAQAAARTLLEIVDDVLDFSKIEAEKLEIEHIDFELGHVVSQLIGACALNAARKNLEFVVDQDPALPRVLRGDPLRLTQVLLNLTSNAIKFSERGHVTLRIELEACDALDHARVRFAVEDTGIGLSSEHVARIFQPFVQGDNSISRRYGGTGLGLSISKRLVTLMGGELAVDSELGRGSTFWFRLGFPSEGSAAPEPWGLGVRLLLVEDSAPQAQALRRTLEAHGYDLEWAQSPAAASAVLRESRSRGASIGLALIDRFPLDGAAWHRLREELQRADVPQVLLAAHGDQTSIDDPALVLSKPWERPALRETLRAASEKRRPLAAPRPPALAKEVLRGRSVLVVQDAPVLRDLLGEVLQTAGAEAIFAADGEQAISQALSQQFDLVLMDLRLPGMDGCAATRTIHAQPGNERLPILAVTASHEASELARCRAAGMQVAEEAPGAVDLLARMARALAATPQKPSAPRAPGKSTRESDGPLRNRRPTPRPPDQTSSELDLDATLARLDGNFDMFRRLLRRFVLSHEHSGAELELLLTNGEFERARLLAHTLAGSAAAIGARRLPGVSQELERALKRGNTTDLEAPLREFAIALTATLTATRHALSAARSRAPSGTMPVIAARAAVEQLRRLVHAHDTAAVDALDLVRRLLPSDGADHLNALEARIHAYDFEAASRELKTLGPTLEPLAAEPQHGS